jgi:hypothetical protein
MIFLNPPSRLGYCDPLTAAITIGGGMMAGGIASKPGNISAPKARNYEQEMNKALDAQAGIQDKLIGLEGQYTPKYQELQKNTLMGQMGTLSSLYGTANQYAGQLGNQYMDTMTPLYQRAGQSSMGAYGSMLGSQAMGIYGQMGQQAQAGLNAGYGLNEQQQRLAEQSARAAMGARGMQFGNQAIAQEVLNSYNLGNTRYQQNLANAQNYLGTSQQMAGQAYNMYGQPLMNQLNAYSPSGMLGTSATFAGALGTSIFNPESQYNADLIGANQSNQMNATMANLQADSAFSSGLLSAGSSIMSAGVKKG